VISIGELKTLKGYTDLRNGSIYAHGEKPIDKNRSEKFFNFVRENLQRHLREKNQELDDMLNQIKFPVWK